MMRRFYYLIVLGALTLLLLITFASHASVLRGFSAQVVLSGSMKPAVSPGSLVITKALAAGQYSVGDVITYRIVGQKDGAITHRIIRRIPTEDGGQSFETKGDANPNGDLVQVGASQIEGKVVEVIPKLGFIYEYEQTRKGFLVTGVTTFFILVLGEFYIVLRFCESCILSLRRKVGLLNSKNELQE